MRMLAKLATFKSLYNVKSETVCSVLLFLFLIQGLLLVLFLPPFQAPDEEAHWKSSLPVMEEPCLSLYSLPEYFSVSSLAHNSAAKISFERFNMLEIESLPKRCLASKVTYTSLFSYPGSLLSHKLLSQESSAFRALSLFYVSRILQGIFILLIALRLLSFSKKDPTEISLVPLFGLMLLPLYAQQCFSISSDMITFAAILSALGCFFYSSLFTKGDWLAVAFIICVGTLTKPPLGLLIAALLLCSIVKFPHYRIYLGILLVSVFCLVACSLCNDYSVSDSQRGVLNLNPQAQLAVVFRHPFSLFLNINSVLFSHLVTMKFVSPLGWLNADLGRYVKIIYGVFFLAIAMLHKLSPNKNWKLSYFLCITSYGYCCILCIIAFLFWTEVGSLEIQGIQARYFLPALLVIIAAFLCNITFKSQNSRWTLSIAYLTIMVQMVMLIDALINRYWF